MKKIKKHIAIIIFFISLFIMISLLTFVYVSKDHSTFYLKDHKGDRSVLNDITVQGELRDAYHTVHFTIENNKVTKNTKIYSYPISDPTNRSWFRWMETTLDGVDYEILGEGEFDIYRNRRKTSDVPQGWSHVKTDIHPSSAVNQVELGLGLAQVGESIYFTVPTTSAYVGNNHIYEIEFVDPSQRISRTDGFTEQRVIATYSLEQNGDSTSKTIDVLGLQGVGDHLALIKREGNDLVIREFHTDGEEVGGTILDNFFLDVETRLPYTAYLNEADNIITLSFSHKRDEFKVVNIEFAHGEGFEIIDVVDVTFEGELDENHRLVEMFYKNNKLYVANTLKDMTDERNFIYSIGRPIQFFLHVYEGNELLYQGEIVTDMNDDLIRFQTAPFSAGGVGYDYHEHRNFVHISFK
ncbi:hypothetical protein QA612_16545 [Evansella sp. AB-P1]|uniref:hypothetical protein n=1 Tax=Evansella sp. AB-P1 TaxID=3037653 RepID=UPI00241FE667|nr:hypothetical protein [Evansella sp. AB-P1]MDG5789068.1 hypothetical protein [Evansella sp. AB-P1]